MILLQTNYWHFNTLGIRKGLLLIIALGGIRLISTAACFQKESTINTGEQYIIGSNRQTQNFEFNLRWSVQTTP